jgi:signal transduction histidine kinase
MQQLVTTYLDRARIASRSAIVGKKSDGIHVMLRLIRVMEKLNPRITYAMVRPDASLPWFRGDESDLEEMAGNLLDNACKWAQSRVNVEVMPEFSQVAPTLRIIVDDDGPGLTAEEREQVARRGRRLDETKPGSGLGLSIVVELASLYGGSLTLGSAPIGGLRAELVLPAV